MICETNCISPLKYISSAIVYVCIIKHGTPKLIAVTIYDTKRIDQNLNNFIKVPIPWLSK